MSRCFDISGHVTCSSRNAWSCDCDSNNFFWTGGESCRIMQRISQGCLSLFLFRSMVSETQPQNSNSLSIFWKVLSNSFNWIVIREQNSAIKARRGSDFKALNNFSHSKNLIIFFWVWIPDFQWSKTKWYIGSSLHMVGCQDWTSQESGSDPENDFW